MIRYESKFDSDQTKLLFDESSKKSKLVIIVLCLLFIIIGIIELSTRKNNIDILSAIFFIIIGFIIYPIYLLIIKLIIRKRNESTFILSHNTLEEYIFDDNYINVIINKGDDYLSNLKMKYNCLFKVIETKKSFILFISNSQCFVVDKEKIVEGSNEELRNILNEKVEKKFKKR